MTNTTTPTATIYPKAGERPRVWICSKCDEGILLHTKATRLRTLKRLARQEGWEFYCGPHGGGPLIALCGDCNTADAA